MKPTMEVASSPGVSPQPQPSHLGSKLGGPDCPALHPQQTKNRQRRKPAIQSLNGGRGKLTILTLCGGSQLSSHLPAGLPWANIPTARARTSQFLLHHHGHDALSISQRVYSLYLKPSWTIIPLPPSWLRHRISVWLSTALGRSWMFNSLCTFPGWQRSWKGWEVGREKKSRGGL